MNRKTLTSGSMATVIAVGLMLLFVWSGLRARAMAAELDRRHVAHRELATERDRLRAEVVALTSIDRIKRIAAEQIGLIDPTEAPVDVPAVAPMGSADSLESARATGLETIGRRTIGDAD